MLRQAVEKKNKWEVETIQTLKKYDDLLEKHEKLNAQFEKLKEVQSHLLHFRCIYELKFNHVYRSKLKLKRNWEKSHKKCKDWEQS